MRIFMDTSGAGSGNLTRYSLKAKQEMDPNARLCIQSFITFRPTSSREVLPRGGLRDR